MIDEVRLYHGSVSEEDVIKRFQDPNFQLANAKTVMNCSFNEGTAQDASGMKNHGQAVGVKFVDGQKFGGAVQLVQRGGGNRGGSSFVKRDWTKDLPILARAMVLCNDVLFVAGPPDLIDEESTFERLVSRDPKVAAVLAAQDAALDGEQGGKMLAINTNDGSIVAEYQLESLPIWDGLICANGRLYLTTESGDVLCMEAK